MKELIKFFCLLLVVVSCANTRGSAQRGYRGHYGRGYSPDYANVYRRNISPSYHGAYNAYNYRPPVVVGNYRPIVFGRRYYGLPHGSISITFGGLPYYYSGGTFYQPYGGYYRSIFPPIGIHVGALPFGYFPIYVGADLFYFYNGIFYRRYNDRSYEVVDAPMGAQLSSLPTGARSVVVNGEKFYELNGTFFKEDRNAKGQVVYTVVGKNGRIDNAENEPPPAPAPTPSPTPAPPTTVDRVSELPNNCKTVVVNGQKLYVSPNDTYYRLESDGTYSVVGSASQNVM